MEAWQATEVILLASVVVAPMLIVVLMALFRGYSILFWKHEKGAHLPFVGIVRPDEEDDDA